MSLDPDDRMSKVRPLLSMINERCLNNFVKQQELSLDESMIPYYGRHGSKQFIRGKPIRFGYKFSALTLPLDVPLSLSPTKVQKVGRPKRVPESEWEDQLSSILSLKLKELVLTTGHLTTLSRH